MSETINTPKKKTPVRAGAAAWVGTTLEYYDFAIYGTASALIFDRLFFSPEMPEGIRVLLSMLIFAVGYLVRPLGALILGPVGDRYGRKVVMLITLFGIGIGTFLIGCLPTFDQTGVIAPILLVLIRVTQGLCMSGEQASSITMSLEHAPERRRGFVTSFTTLGASSGTLLSMLIFIPISAMPDEQLYSWGWRIPFWLSAVVILGAYLIRRHIEEPPSFNPDQSTGGTASPLRDALRYNWRAVVRVALCALIAGTSYMMQTFSVAFATTGYKLDRPTMLLVTTFSAVIALAVTPLAGLLVDRIGRRTVFITGALGAGLTMAPYLWSITTGNWFLIFLFGIVNYSFFYSMVNASWPSFFAEMFPTRVRVSGLALGTQVGFALSGFAGPVLATALAGADLSNWFGASAVALGFMVLAVGSACTAKETAHRDLSQLDEPRGGAESPAPRTMVSQ